MLSKIVCPTLQVSVIVLAGGGPAWFASESLNVRLFLVSFFHDRVHDVCLKLSFAAKLYVGPFFRLRP